MTPDIVTAIALEDASQPAAERAVRAVMRIAVRHGTALDRGTAEEIAEAVLGCKAPCAGKGFEHHQQVVVPEGGDRWNCPDCGDTGSYADFEAYSRRLLSLLPLLYRLKEQMLDRGAVIMVPTEAAPGSLGTFYGLDVLRVPGLAEPMIAVSAAIPGV